MFGGFLEREEIESGSENSTYSSLEGSNFSFEISEGSEESIPESLIRGKGLDPRLEPALREEFQLEIAASIYPYCSHVPMAAVRRKIATINSRFDVIKQQVRGKLFNISKKIRKEKGLSISGRSRFPSGDLELCRK